MKDMFTALYAQIKLVTAIKWIDEDMPGKILLAVSLNFVKLLFEELLEFCRFHLV